MAIAPVWLASLTARTKRSQASRSQADMPQEKPRGAAQLLLAVLTVSLVCALAACGQKGPLYLPESNPSPEDREDA